MNLSRYNDKCVRVTTVDGEVFEGVCSHNSAEYNEHEFGEHEEGIQLTALLLYKSQIAKIESLEGHTGPYGKYSGPYGKLEEDAVDCGIDIITEHLFCEDDEQVLRMLSCLDDRLDPGTPGALDCRDETLDALRELRDIGGDGKVRGKTEEMLKKWG